MWSHFFCFFNERRSRGRQIEKKSGVGVVPLLLRLSNLLIDISPADDARVTWKAETNSCTFP